MDLLMYKRILVCLENSPTDQFIVSHIKQLAKHCAASLLLIHVADGWAARNIKHMEGLDREPERARVAADFVTTGLRAEALLATGDPSSEITSAAEREKCDLIAMATHGHKLLGDMIHGSVATSVRHKSMVPVLLVRAPAKPTA